MLVSTRACPPRQKVRGKISGVIQARDRRMHGPTQVVLRVGMGAWKTGALFPERLRHPSHAEIPLQQLARYPVIGDTPVRLRKVFPQAQGGKAQKSQPLHWGELSQMDSQ